MSFVAKPDGGMRLVADLVHLNKFVKIPVHPFMSAKDIINQIESDANYFATLDAKSGYWQLEFEEESRRYTCFIMECTDTAGRPWVWLALETFFVKELMLCWQESQGTRS